MKTCATAMGIWVLCAGLAWADPCGTTKRIIAGRVVDLQPLFDWWSGVKGGTRPLLSWKHLSGSIVRETFVGWIMSGEVEGETEPSKFFLRNPPREQLEQFQELQRRLAGCQRERASLNVYLKRPVRNAYDEYWGYHDPLPPITISEQQAALTRLDGLDQTIASLRQQIAGKQDERGNFRFDGFALRLNERSEGLPVFDHGYPFPIP
jgi:hypothetical protein